MLQLCVEGGAHGALLRLPPRHQRQRSNGHAAELEARIERRLEEDLGYRVDTFLRTASELAALAAEQPFPGADGTVYIAFLKASPQRARLALLEAQDEHNRIEVRGREVHWSCCVPSRLSRMSGALLEKLVDAPATLRNRNTVLRLASRYLP
ncbi:MAG: DUF1697 domain-containing protein [Candidatus Eremiobacterota bacterium]